MLKEIRTNYLLLMPILIIIFGMLLILPNNNIKASTLNSNVPTYANKYSNTNKSLENKNNNKKPSNTSNNENIIKNNESKPHQSQHRNSRFLKYRFISQTGRGNANDGCEAASLLMALNHFKLARHQNLRHFVKRIPRSWNPERGYTGNPFVLGTGASLYPKALLKVAKHYGAKRSYIIDDYYRYGRGLYGHKASAKSFIKAILKGFPVVFEGGNRMQYGGRTYRRGYRGYKSDHVLMLYGYKNGRFYWTDPDHRHNKHGNTRVKLFMYIINAPVRGPRAVAIGK